MKRDSLIVHGVPFSQPVRAVLWLLVMKRTPFTLKLVNPGSSGKSGSRNPEYLEKNPAGTIPLIEEPENGFVLGEAHAILPYLCDRHGWHDLYPQELKQRARINWYLHFHHRNIREASIAMVAPKIRKDLEIPAAIQEAAKTTFGRALTSIEQGWLRQQGFLVDDKPSIADLAAYVELGQMRAGFTNVFDFSGYPNVAAWLERMAALDGHDDVHVVLADIGDISTAAPSIDTIRDANKNALSVLNERIEEFERSA